MKLPNGEKALIDRRKLIEYCLNPQHPTGRHKARVFAAAGITIEDVDYLLDALRNAATEGTVTTAEQGTYGTRYALDFEITRNSRILLVRSAWITPNGDDRPRLTTCYLLRGYALDASD